MIGVARAAEPSDFTAKVRTPGTTFLQSTPKPRSTDWNGHDYWRKATNDLLQAYRNICAYSGSRTHRSTSSAATSLAASSVDHYLPKSKYPAKAYEWSNYRLARARLNNRKGNHQDVLDPFRLPSGWFVLDFRTFLLRPNAMLSDEDKSSVIATIARLGLNSDNDYVSERTSVVQQYCQNMLTFADVNRHWPYIASEMIAQGFDKNIRPHLSRAFLSLPVGP